MQLIGLDKDIIKASQHKDGFYIYTMGVPCVVTIMNKDLEKNPPSLGLYLKKKSDKMLTEFYPNNKIYFDEDLIESNDKILEVSCHVDNLSSCLFIGKLGKYRLMSGTLVLTSNVSLNGYIDNYTEVLASSSTPRINLLTKVLILSLGLTKNGVLGLMYIPARRGIAYSYKDTENITETIVSAKNNKSIDAIGWNRYTIEDWLHCCLIKESAKENDCRFEIGL